MGRGLLYFVLVLLICLPFVSAVDTAAADQAALQAQIDALIQGAVAAGTPGSYQVTAADLEKIRADLMKDLRDYSDEQFGALDGRIQQFFIQFRQKIIMGILGVNALVAGIIFYYLNRVNKGLSYESVALRRRKDEEDRQSVVKHMNFIRERLQEIEGYNAKLYDTYVIPVNKFLEVQQAQIDEHQRFIDEQYQQSEGYYDQSNDGWQGEDQGAGQEYGPEGADGGGSGEFAGGASDGGFEGSEYGAGPYEAGFSMEGTNEQQFDPNYPSQ